MHVLSIINKSGGRQAFFMASAETAIAAYQKAHAAMSGYRPFKNYHQEVVTLEMDVGEATFLVEDLAALHMEDLSKSEAVLIEKAVWEATVRAKVAARLAPSA